MSYRNAIVRQDRKLLGVCAAIANSMGVQAIWVRLATIALTIFVTAWVIPVYLIGGWGLTRAQKNRRSSQATRSRYLGTRSQYLSDSNRMLSNRDSELARQIDALR